MLDKREIVKKAICAIETTSELFYQQNIQEGYAQLEQTLAILSGLADLLFEKDTDFVDCQIDSSRFSAILSDALGALEQKDTILLSDILQYDLKELLADSLQ